MVNARRAREEGAVRPALPGTQVTVLPGLLDFLEGQRLLAGEFWTSFNLK